MACRHRKLQFQTQSGPQWRSALHRLESLLKSPCWSHRAVGGVDALVGLPSLSINKLSVDEQLMGDLYSHVVDILFHLRRKRTIRSPSALVPRGSAGTHIVHHQLLRLILATQLPDTHLDEILEGGVHVDVLVLQLAAAGAELDFLHQPEGWRR